MGDFQSFLARAFDGDIPGLVRELSDHTISQEFWTNTFFYIALFVSWAILISAGWAASISPPKSKVTAVVECKAQEVDTTTNCKVPSKYSTLELELHSLIRALGECDTLAHRILEIKFNLDNETCRLAREEMRKAGEDIPPEFIDTPCDKA